VRDARPGGHWGSADDRPPVNRLGGQLCILAATQR